MGADIKPDIKGTEIWTIGHSNRTQTEFLNCLKSFHIEILVDVRRFPGSKKYPQFNVDALEKYLSENGIRYIQNVSLGGRRKPRPDSKNTIWRNDAFRGYADYSESEEFRNGIIELTDYASSFRTAYMCSEAVWWRCHRSIISDYLKEYGWKVMHIMKENVATEHPFTSAFLQTHPQNVPYM
jgi:uncharacterized protein (DUF488 family)